MRAQKKTKKEKNDLWIETRFIKMHMPTNVYVLSYGEIIRYLLPIFYPKVKYDKI